MYDIPTIRIMYDSSRFATFLIFFCSEGVGRRLGDLILSDVQIEMITPMIDYLILPCRSRRSRYGVMHDAPSGK